MPEKDDDKQQSPGDAFVQSLHDAVTFKKQRDAVSNAVDSAENTVKSKIKSGTDYLKNQYQEAKDILGVGQSSNKPAAKPSYKKGTDYVPKTGDAKLHEGEAVLKKEDADKYRAMKAAGDELGGSESKPKKEIKHIVTKKAKSGGYIHEHHHTKPEHHPVEEHVSKDQDAMVDHMLQHLGTPNEGEEEAEAAGGGSPSGEAMEAPTEA